MTKYRDCRMMTAITPTWCATTSRTRHYDTT